jgi:hypothetical protein
MTIRSALRNRLPGPAASPRSRSVGDTRSDPVSGGGPPYAGYDRLSVRQVIDGLSEHSQIELEAVESYERSHQNREPVLDKLRWMRGREPLPGYDAFDAEEIVAALGDADLVTIKRVRAYERKFANRPAVLDEVVRVHHLGLAAQPASPKPSYQPMSGAGMGATVVNSRGDRTERG